MACQGPLRRQLSTELGLFGDLLDVSGDQGRGATQPNPDLGIWCGQGGAPFRSFGPTQAWVPQSTRELLI